MKSLERNIEVLDDRMVDVLKRKNPIERLAIAFGLWRSARKQLMHYLHTIHPDWSDEKIQREVAKRLSHGAA